MPLSEPAKLEDQRRQLVQWLELYRPHGSPRNTVTVVFDGRSDIWGAAGTSGEIQIIFAQNESADARLIRMVEESSARKSTVVVSDDRAVQYAVRALGARVSGVRAFWVKTKLTPVSTSPEAGKHISNTLEHKITSELAKIWLGKGKNKNP